MPLSSSKCALLCHGVQHTRSRTSVPPVCTARLFSQLPFSWIHTTGLSSGPWNRAEVNATLLGWDKQEILPKDPACSLSFARLKKRSQQGQTGNRMVMDPQIQYECAWKTGAKEGKTVRVRSRAALPPESATDPHGVDTQATCTFTVC